MKKLYYDEGPAVMSVGVAGAFRIGEPREVEDDLAAVLLKKGRLKEFKEDQAAAPSAKGKTAGPQKKED